MNNRAKMVIETDPIMAQPIWFCVNCSSSRTTAISGAMPNHAKKHEKKANHVMWNVLICGIFTFRKFDHSPPALVCDRSSPGSQGHPKQRRDLTEIARGVRNTSARMDTAGASC
jgi:hypothetical protein